jgi:hypothetical protein
LCAFPAYKGRNYGGKDGQKGGVAEGLEKAMVNAANQSDDGQRQERELPPPGARPGDFGASDEQATDKKGLASQNEIDGRGQH